MRIIAYFDNENEKALLRCPTEVNSFTCMASAFFVRSDAVNVSQEPNIFGGRGILAVKAYLEIELKDIDMTFKHPEALPPSAPVVDDANISPPVESGF